MLSYVGYIKKYKNVPLLIDRFIKTSDENSYLIVAIGVKINL